ERIIGAPHTIAHRWAEERSFPLLPSEMDNLPQVAQYVATQEGYDALRDSLRLWILGEMSRRFPSALPENWLDRLLSENMVTVGRHLRATEPQEPHEMLARLPFPVYITTNPDDLLADALASVGRPNLTQRIFSWNDHDGDDPYRQRDPDD